MIKLTRAFVIGGLVIALPARAVYAPIPEQEQGKDLTLSIRGGLSYDSNIFGAADDAVDSLIWTLAPRAVYNASVTDQTFLAAAYGLTLDRFDDRPGDKLLDSHDLTLRVAHAFSKVTTIDLNESFTISRNPESLLAGRTLNADQSFTRNQVDGRFTTPITAKLGTTIKARSIYLKYRDDVLGRSLDRVENLFGLSGDFAFLPEVKLVGEYRHQDVYYRKLGEIKNKSSNYVMGGADYEMGNKVSLSGRVGAEWRERRALPDSTAPYVEISAKYDFTEKSFLAGGYIYTLEETSQPERFTDAKIHRMFGNVQHALSALIVASASVTYEPSTLQGRPTFASIDETTIRAGAALTYLASKSWTTSASFDHDRVRSDDAPRNLRRSRAALSATYTF